LAQGGLIPSTENKQPGAVLNRELWDELATIHNGIGEYGRNALLSGKSTLRAVEISLLGDIRGARILHSHCHLGYDTISLSRLGASVVGVDISPRSIALARELAEDLCATCEFQLIDDWRHFRNSDQFDVFYATYGVIEWLSDLDIWFAAASDVLRPTGRLILIDGHPALHTLAERKTDKDVFYAITDPYQTGGASTTARLRGSYADRTVKLSRFAAHRWKWSVADIVTRCLKHGFILQHFGEYDFSHYCKFAGHRRSPDGYFRNVRLRGFPSLLSVVFVKA
jgi:SAM-dependent methyltransferase